MSAVPSFTTAETETKNEFRVPNEEQVSARMLAIIDRDPNSQVDQWHDTLVDGGYYSECREIVTALKAPNSYKKDKRLKAEVKSMIRRLGESIYERGGHDTMVNLFYTMKNFFFDARLSEPDEPFYAASRIEFAWDGVGRWQA